MCRFLALVFLDFVFLSPTSTLLAAEDIVPDPEESPCVTIRIYNYVRFPDWQLSRVKKAVAGILERAGIRIAWIDCPTCAEEVSKCEACYQPLQPRDLILKVVHRFPWKEQGKNKDAFALTAGHNLLVDCDRLMELSHCGEALESEILGVAIAHEIGHALLGPGAHCPRGIMCPRWIIEDFNRTLREDLCFTEEQAALMRQALASNR
jgi:hypothetical protein